MPTQHRLDWAQVSETDFEELCCDLLRAMGYANIDWRRGTDKASTTPDSGRDIEATLSRADPDGTEVREKWFIEAKRFTGALPAGKLSGAISWAQAERPDVLLIVTSGFLSNAAKDWLQHYVASNRPAFRVKRWERPQLEQLLRTFPEVASKYFAPKDVAMVVWESALREWEEHLLLASPDRLQMFFENYESLAPSDHQKYFLLRSELTHGSPTERDWFSKFSPQECAPLFAIAVHQTIHEVFKGEELKRGWRLWNPALPYLLLRLLRNVALAAALALVWSPYRFYEIAPQERRQLNVAYRRAILPGVVTDATRQMLDRCSRDCEKLQWPPEDERRDPRGFLILEKRDASCRLGISIEVPGPDSWGCPLMAASENVSPRLTRKNLMLWLITLRAADRAQCASEEAEPTP